VVLNAAAALWVYGAAENLERAMSDVRRKLADGTVAGFVQHVMEVSERLAKKAAEEAE